ncbi:MAG: hypothetical protein R3208_11340 [Ketobacteraceae bacterium]|nr:hypothetical protein [Ketobacteraceae bacterium]
MVSLNRETVTLYRSVGPGQLKCIADSGWKRFPPRLHWQRYFYPMLHESFAHRIASQWNVEQSGVGYVVRFRVRKEYIDPLPVYIIGGPEHKEYRIPAEDFERLNSNIVGAIEVLAAYHDHDSDWQQAMAWA